MKKINKIRLSRYTIFKVGVRHTDFETLTLLKFKST